MAASFEANTHALAEAIRTAVDVARKVGDLDTALALAFILEKVGGSAGQIRSISIV